MMILRVVDLSVRFGGADVVKGINLEVREGEKVALIGNNGAGKTTILRTVSGLERPLRGEISFLGRRIDGMPPPRIVKMGMGHVPQGRELFPYMGVLENIKLGAFLLRDKKTISDRLEEIFRIFPVLKMRKRQQAGTLSGGEQQMLAIARALMGDPKLILMDEPTTGLAPIVVNEIGKIVVEINKSGTEILLVEQNARMALRLAHRGYVMETGSIVLEGNCGDLMKDERVKKAYLGK